MKRFKFGRGEDGFNYIFNPLGRAVLRYAALPRGRLGNRREWDLWLLDGHGDDAEQLACCHGGLTRSVMKFLNTGAFIEEWHSGEFMSDEAVGKLRELRAWATRRYPNDDMPCEHCDSVESLYVRRSELRGWVCAVCDDALDYLEEIE